MAYSRDVVMVQTRIPRENHEELKKISLKNGISMNAVVNIAITQYLQSQDFKASIDKLDNVVNNVMKMQSKKR